MAEDPDDKASGADSGSRDPATAKGLGDSWRPGDKTAAWSAITEEMLEGGVESADWKPGDKTATWTAVSPAMAVRRTREAAEEAERLEAARVEAARAKAAEQPAEGDGVTEDKPKRKDTVKFHAVKTPPAMVPPPALASAPRADTGRLAGEQPTAPVAAPGAQSAQKLWPLIGATLVGAALGAGGLWLATSGAEAPAPAPTPPAVAARPAPVPDAGVTPTAAASALPGAVAHAAAPEVMQPRVAADAAAAPDVPASDVPADGDIVAAQIASPDAAVSDTVAGDAATVDARDPDAPPLDAAAATSLDGTTPPVQLDAAAAMVDTATHRADGVAAEAAVAATPDVAAGPPDVAATTPPAAPPIQPTGSSEGCPEGLVRGTRPCRNKECTTKPDGVDFCVATHEYPGAGSKPKVEIDRSIARKLCARRDQHLCSHWELRAVCGKPYPYGPKYTAGACNIRIKGGPAARVREGGSTPTCVSPAGVYDLVGNAAELTTEGTLFGGSAWSGAGAQCTWRKVETMKPRTVGFRCCATPK